VETVVNVSNAAALVAALIVVPDLVDALSELPAVAGVAGTGQGAGQARSQGAAAGHDLAELSCPLDGVFLSAVRRRNPPECQAVCRPDIPVGRLVDLVRADGTNGGWWHHEQPIWARRRTVTFLERTVKQVRPQVSRLGTCDRPL
jgi:hypothetical protein